MFRKIFAIATISLGFLGCQVTTPFHVTSDDGKVVLNLDASALPAGVDSGDIRISSLLPDESLTFDDEKPLALYKLEPEGLKLSKVAMVTLEMPFSDHRIPGLYHVAESGIEPLVTDTTIDEKAGKITLQTKIDHFSVLILRSEDFELSIRAPKYVFVGVPFDVSGKVDKIREKRDVIVTESGTDWFDILVKSLGLNPNNIQPRQVIGEIEIKDPWSVEDKLQALDDSPVTPVLHQENREDVNGNTHEYTKQFTCTEPGNIIVRYNPSLQTPNTSYKSLTPNRVEMSTREFPHTILSDDIECLDYVVCGGMGIDDAAAISAEFCDGAFMGTQTCNEATGTWWLDLDLQQEGCMPACVVNIETKKAEINWRCTGVLESGV